MFWVFQPYDGLSVMSVCRWVAKEVVGDGADKEWECMVDWRNKRHCWREKKDQQENIRKICQKSESWKKEQ